MKLGQVLGLFCLSLPWQQAWADGDPFLGTDPPMVAAAGERDLQQWLSWRSGHTGEGFQDFESLTEFDYGLTDRLQLALTLAYDWNRVKPPGSPALAQDFVGLAGEVIAVLLPVEQSPLGLSLALDPYLNAAERGIDVRLLLQKDILGLQNVLDINLENGWERLGPGNWQGSSGLSFNYGIAYPLDPQWTVALEFGNERSFNRLFTDGGGEASNSFFLGPTLQYDGALAVVTLGMQAQLPWASGPGARDGFTPDTERFRLGLRFAREI
jgi:hypothetical protein